MKTKKITKGFVLISMFISFSSLAQLTVVSSGKVGIGSSSPGEELEVKTTDATIRIFNSNDAGGAFAGNTYSAMQFGIFNPSGSTFGVIAAGAKRSFFGFDNNGKVGSLTNAFGSPTFRNIIDDGSGNAGFGTTSPTAAMEVASGNIYVTKASAYNALKFIRSSNSYAGSINFSTTTANDWLIGERPTTDSDFHIYDYGVSNDVMLIKKSNGYVGIGQFFTPSYPLDVYGDINATVNVRANGVILTSDQKYKTNVTPVSNALSLVNKLAPCSYFWDTTNNKANGMKFTGEKQYGLISQEVEKILPELIYVTKKSATYDTSHNELSQATTYKGLNYIAFIPIVIKAVQELSVSNDSLKSVVHKQDSAINALQSKVNGLTGTGGKKAADDNQDAAIKSLQEQVNNCCSKSGSTNANGTTVINGPTLFQNIPNPFNQTTNIKCFIPDVSKSVSLLIMDMNGTLKKTIILNSRGEVNTTINAKELIAGMYFYTLIIDGNEIDTKKMILTE